MTDKKHTPDTLTGHSLNIATQRKKELQQLFPAVFTETLNDQGDVVSTVDFERLKAELGEFSDIFDNRRERYGMDWPGKRDCLRIIQEPSHATLKPCREESVDFDTTENLFIEGDNLEVLKILQKSYYGQIKMIYIDPPYNTGKEFIYPDNFSESLDTYLEYAGLKEIGGEGRKWSTNTANEGRFHTKWLNMMYPRLYLARNLLKDDGVIFISIDDNEVENLRRMCDEIFGEENFLSCFSWRTDGNFDNQAKIKNCHEYILMYARSIEHFPPPPVIDPNTNTKSKLFKSEIKNTIVKNGPKNPVSKLVLPKGFPARFSNSVIKKQSNDWPHYLSDAIIENNTLQNEVTVVSGWSSKELLTEFIENNFKPILDQKGQKTFFEITLTGAIEVIKERSNAQSHVLSSLTGLGGTQKAQSELEKIGITFDDYPKPTQLIEYLIRMQEGEEFTVLDFFAGSSSTAHSVFNVSFKDNKNIKFINVQLPELLKNGSKAKLAGYKAISEISIARIKAAGQEIKSKIDKNSLEIDLGFKVLKLDQSNFKPWQAPSKDISDEELIRQLEIGLEHIEPNANDEDLVYELMLKAGIMPSEKIEIIELAGYKMYNVAGDYLYIYLGNTVDQALFDAVLEKQPEQFICLDSAFQGKDQLKANAVKTFATFNTQKDNLDRITFFTV